ncbi:LysE family translocator [Thalassospira sp.]|uniref:LysE family translocator n=1 Tax=Thalassospira sp. TaxID=1912094 RepID=UPI000C3CEF1B|nr:LysE family translocator [Thalassospira sp.]MBC06973.1 lysine transporter LysE [Thalassospira sp.]|tara:strand:+ start:10441 stop:11043 length:603 start_codon:yes stop_codon:yes gene_type:complete
MNPENLTALIGFAFVMSVSPGPGNFLLLASGANFGIARTIPLILGISSGFLSMVFLIGLGLGEVLERFPMAQDVLRLICFGYILWLAYKISQIRSLDGTGPQTSKPIGFVQAAMLQLLNPKAWTVALIVTATYTAPDAGIHGLLTMIAVFALVNIPSISSWAMFGATMRSFISQGNRARIFNIIMAVLLVASMAPMLLPL